ncbi:MAG: foldase protein PrsA [Burkholderiaceae bacterium]
MMITRAHILLISTVAVLALSACHSKNAAKSETGNDAVVATVNGEPIKASRIDKMVQQGVAQGQQDSPELRKKIIENLAIQTVLAEAAVKKGLDKSPEAAEQLELIRRSVLANAFVQDYLKNNPVTDDMIKAEYEKVKAQKSGNEYKARHILVAKEADAKEIIAKLKKDPKAFAALAKEKSIDPGSKANGGDLGWFAPQRMVPEFGAAVAKLEKGKFTEEPVKSQFGYHVIVLDDVRPVQFPPLEQVKEQVKQQVQQENMKKLIDEMKAKAKIEYVSAPPTASSASTPQSTPMPK